MELTKYGADNAKASEDGGRDESITADTNI